MSDEHLTHDFDLDEDLFDFGEVTDAAWAEQEEADLDEIFANFEAEEEARKEAEKAQEDELFDEVDPDELPAPEDFAGLNPDPPPAIPQPVQGAEPSAPPLTPPTPEETGAVPPPPSQPVPQAPQPQAVPHVQPVQPAAYGAPAPPPQPVYYQTVAAPPVPPPATAVPAGPFGMSRSLRVAAWILITVTSINALVALVALKSTGDLRQSVRDVGDQVTRTATDLMRDNVGGMADIVSERSSGQPLSAPNPENHPTFELAREEIQRGEYARARQRLYGLLAIVDRLDPLVREQVEARANYLLAQAVHLQTVDEWEQAR